MHTILIVDDEPDVHELLRKAFDPKEVRVLSALDGKEGLATLKEEKPDLVLLDIMMPGLDGRDALRAIRADPETKAVRVVVYSARDEQVDRNAVLELGADDYIAKPEPPRLLARKLLGILKGERQKR